jgi:hypothetical protein
VVERVLDEDLAMMAVVKAKKKYHFEISTRQEKY